MEIAVCNICARISEFQTSLFTPVEACFADQLMASRFRWLLTTQTRSVGRVGEKSRAFTISTMGLAQIENSAIATTCETLDARYSVRLMLN